MSRRSSDETLITTSVRRPVALLLAFVLGGTLFGAAVAHIPAPSEPTLFWIGNFSAPWAVLPFLAGRGQRSWIWAVAAGVSADIACVVGFYAGFITADPGRLGLPPSTPSLQLVTAGMALWLNFIAPWLALALMTGAGYGLLGWWWGRSRPLIAGLAVMAPFIAEPLAWRIYRGFFPGPYVLWLVELVAGVIILAWTLRRIRPAGQQRL